MGMEVKFLDDSKITANFTRKGTESAVRNITLLFYSVIEQVQMNHFTSKVNLCLTRVLFPFAILNDLFYNY
jgi:hypothetical protein